MYSKPIIKNFRNPGGGGKKQARENQPQCQCALMRNLHNVHHYNDHHHHQHHQHHHHQQQH